MPMDMSRYPPDWKTISLAIRERANWVCEWCGVKNKAIGARDRDGRWHDEDDIHSMNSGAGFDAFGDEFPTMIRIVLTVAHLGTVYPDGTPGDKHDKMDCRPENLTALCQRCHLNYDRDEHAHNARQTRLRKKARAVARAGQAELLV